MKKKKDVFDEQVMTATKKFHALASEMLDADVPPEVISIAMAKNLSGSIAAIALLKEGKTPEKRETFVKVFFGELVNMTLENVKILEASKEAGHGEN